MFVFGHLGIGQEIVDRSRPGLAARWVLLGTVLPDLIDKPLYYGLSTLYGKSGADLGLICGTRTFGHCGIFFALLLLSAVACSMRSGSSRVALALWAVVLGVSTHLGLDLLGDVIAYKSERSFATMDAFLFPLRDFYPLETVGMRDHLARLFSSAYVIGGEILGICLLRRKYGGARKRVRASGRLD